MSYDYNGNMTSTSVEKLSEIEGDPTTLRPSFGMFVSGQEAEGEDVLEHSYAAYTYNNFNQMIEARTGDATSKYQYNAEGYRTITEVNGETTYHIYVNDKVILEIQDDYITVARNIYGNSKLVMRSVDDQSYYYYYNGHGDVIALLDTATNTNIVSYDYDPFGNIIKNTNEDFDNPYLYSGYQYDSETELYYLNARMYDPSMARFMQQDTYLGESSDPLSLNLYSYCSNMPIKYYDPTGHWQQGDEALSVSEQANVIKATNEYFAATTDAGRKAAREKAEGIRNNSKSDNSNQSIDSQSYNEVLSRSKSGSYVDSSEWKIVKTTAEKVRSSLSRRSTSEDVKEKIKDEVDRVYNIPKSKPDDIEIAVIGSKGSDILKESDEVVSSENDFNHLSAVSDYYFNDYSNMYQNNYYTDFNNFNGENSSQYLHSDGFGYRDDNYYVCNLGKDDVFNVYLVSAEVGVSNTIADNNINLGLAVGVSAVDVEIKGSRVGNDKIGVKGEVGAELLTAEANANLKFGSDSGYGLELEAFAAGAAADALVDFEVLGVTVSLKVEAYAGAAGLKVEAYKGPSSFKLEGKAAALFGFGGGFEIKW